MPSQGSFRSLLWRDPVYPVLRDRTIGATTACLQPSADLITAQAGAGKSTIVAGQRGFLDNTVNISLDRLALEFPGYEEDLRKDPFLIDHKAHGAARFWAIRLFIDAARNGRNIVFEVTPKPRTSAVVLAMFSALAPFPAMGYARYARHAHVLAVNARQSVAGIFRRFEDDMDNGSLPRWASLYHHNVSYAHVTQDMQHRQWERAFNDVGVYRRGGRVLYSGGDNALALLTAAGERQHVWEREDINAYERLVDGIRAAAERNAGERPDWYMGAVKELARQAAQIADRRLRPHVNVDRDMDALAEIERTELKNLPAGRLRGAAHG